MSSQPPTVEAATGTPRIIHISDIHGYLADARSALTAVGDTDRFPPIVTNDNDGRLHWAENDYVLIINGDVVDRGPASAKCLELVWRLQQEAPPGRVHYHLGNHELAILLPTFVRWPRAYSTTLDPDEQRAFITRVAEGDVTVAYEGYEYTYSHAGRNEAFRAADVNAQAQAAASELLAEGIDSTTQERIASHYATICQLGRNVGRGADAGICWMDFAHLESSAHPQIVGHSKRLKPVRKGKVVCGNVIRANQGTPGGEGVLLEEQMGLTAIRRSPDGGVVVKEDV